MQKMLFLFNPRSGKAQLKNHLLEIIDIFTKAGYEVTARPTQRNNDAYEYVKIHAPAFDRIVVSGGRWYSKRGRTRNNGNSRGTSKAYRLHSNRHYQ